MDANAEAFLGSWAIRGPSIQDQTVCRARHSTIRLQDFVGGGVSGVGLTGKAQSAIPRLPQNRPLLG